MRSIQFSNWWVVDMRKRILSLLAGIVFVLAESSISLASVLPGQRIYYAYDVTNGFPRLILFGLNDIEPDTFDPFLKLNTDYDSDEGSMNGIDMLDEVKLRERKETTENRDDSKKENQEAKKGTEHPKPNELVYVFPINVKEMHPTDWWVSSLFGPRIDPFTGQLAFHHGVDIATYEGTPIRAFSDGRVVWAGFGGSYGLAVGIQHANGWISWYGHMRSIAVHAGQYVKAGEVIGTVGSTGRSTGPHLHFEIRENGVRIDPWPVLRRLLEDERKD